MTVTLTDIPDKAFKEDLEAGKLGYRSVEILKPDRPEISSLALLDSEVPYFKFPVARFKRSKDKATVAFAEGDDGGVAVVYPWGVQFAMDPKMQKQKYNADNDEDDKEEKGEKKKGKDDDYDGDDKEASKMAAIDDPYPPNQNPGGAPPAAPDAGVPEAGAMPGQPPMPPPEMMPPAPPDPMAGMGDVGGGPDPQLVEAVAAAVAAKLTQQSMAPSPPPAPIAASEPTDQGVKFTMDPQSAARFAEQSAEIAQLKQARAADLLAADIAQRVNTMSQKFQEHDAAGGGKLIERYDPAALQHFAEVAKTQPAADQDAYWAAAEAACKTTFEEPSAAAFTADTSGAPQSAQKFAEGVEDDGPFARWFGADVENRETFEAAADIYAQQFEEMPASRQESYESQRWGKGKKGWVADQLILLEYTPTS